MEAAIEILVQERPPDTHDWVDIFFAVTYWVITLIAVAIFVEVLRGMSVRNKFQRKRRISKAYKSGEVGVGVIQGGIKGQKKCFLCRRQGIKMLSFYVFALITLISRSAFWTVMVLADDGLKNDPALYWLCEAGPYAYILTGLVILIFLIDLLARITQVKSQNNAQGMAIAHNCSKISIIAFMFLVFLCYIIPGVVLSSNKDDYYQKVDQTTLISLTALNLLTFILLSTISTLLLISIHRLFSANATMRHEKFQLLIVLSLYSASFLLTTVYYAYCLSQETTDYLAPATADIVVILRYMACECVPLGLVMMFQYRNQKVIIKEWKEEQRQECATEEDGVTSNTVIERDLSTAQFNQSSSAVAERQEGTKSKRCESDVQEIASKRKESSALDVILMNQSHLDQSKRDGKGGAKVDEESQLLFYSRMNDESLFAERLMPKENQHHPTLGRQQSTKLCQKTLFAVIYSLRPMCLQ